MADSESPGKNERRKELSHLVVDIFLNIEGVSFLVALVIIWAALEQTLQLIADTLFPNASQATLVAIYWVYVPIFLAGLGIIEFMVIRCCRPIQKRQKEKKLKQENQGLLDGINKRTST